MPAVEVTQQQLDLASRLVVTRMMDMLSNGENVRDLDPLWDALSGWKPIPYSLKYWQAQKELARLLAAREESMAKIRKFTAELRVSTGTYNKELWG